MLVVQSHSSRKPGRIRTGQRSEVIDLLPVPAASGRVVYMSHHDALGEALVQLIELAIAKPLEASVLTLSAVGCVWLARESRH